MTIIAVTGTPGVGKTSVCANLKKMGYPVVHISNLIKRYPKFVSGYDRKRKIHEVDAGKIRKYLKKAYSDVPLVFVDSHFSHLLGADMSVVLRCAPEELARRLRNKRYRKAKVNENVEAEILDAVTIECVTIQGKDKVYEIDTTMGNAICVAQTLLRVIKTDDRMFKPGRIDWSEEVLKWY